MTCYDCGRQPGDVCKNEDGCTAQDAPIHSAMGRRLTAPAEPAVTNYGVRKVDPGFVWDGKAQHHVPTLLLEFEPVPVNQSDNLRGWRNRDALAELFSAAPQPADAQATKLSHVETLLDALIDSDPDRAERLIESQLARLALRKRLAAAKEAS